jgi:hypothetical protein
MTSERYHGSDSAATAKAAMTLWQLSGWPEEISRPIGRRKDRGPAHRAKWVERKKRGFSPF